MALSRKGLHSATRSSLVGSHGKFTTIILVVLGADFPKAVLVKLKQYIEAFFVPLQVECIGPVAIDGTKADPAAAASIKRRINPDTQQLQLFAGDCIPYVTKKVAENRDLSRRALVTMGVTMIDLTPKEDWNFVYGLARPMDGCGVFSMHRFSPAFNGERALSPEAEHQLILERCCKVVTHEITHLFGVKHCVHFKCLMNGVNHVGELQLQPLLECPSCTKKLTAQLRWPLRQRYETLAKALRECGFHTQADFVATHLLPRLDTHVASSPGPTTADAEPATAAS